MEGQQQAHAGHSRDCHRHISRQSLGRHSTYQQQALPRWMQSGFVFMVTQVYSWLTLITSRLIGFNHHRKWCTFFPYETESMHSLGARESSHTI